MLKLAQEYQDITAPIWTVQCQYMAMTSYYRMHDPIKGQQLLYDLIEKILYGNVYTISALNPNAKMFKMPENQNMTTNEKTITK